VTASRATQAAMATTTLRRRLVARGDVDGSGWVGTSSLLGSIDGAGRSRRT
jgi:hypothetical protein